MANPCIYKFKGKSYSEAEFKKVLADGLLDKFVLDDNASIPSVFGKKKSDPSETAAEKFRAPVTETAPQAEVTPTETTPQATTPTEAPTPQVKPEPKVVKVMGKDMNIYSDFIPDRQNVESEALYTFKGSSKEEIPELLRDRATVNTSEINGVRRESWNASISGDELIDMYGKETKPTEAPTTQPTAETKTEAPKAETKVNAVESGADMLDKMSEEERDNFIDDWFEDRIPRESLPGGSDAIRFSEARKVAPKPMSKPKRLTMDNAFELSNFHGFVINIDGEIYGLDKFEDPDATSDAEDKFGDPKEYVWAYTKIKDGSDAKSVETYTSDINEVIDEIKASQKATAPKTETKTEAKPVTEPKTETKPATEKVERKGAVEVEAETKRGVKVNYKAELSSDGKTATVQSTAEAPFGGEATNPKIPNLPVKTDSSGNRYVETPSETRVYVDKVKEAPEAKQEAPKQESETKRATVKILSSKPKLDDRGMPIITRFNQEVEFTKNNRTGKWETTDNAGNKIEASADQATRAEEALQEQQKENRNTREKKKRAEANLNAMKEQADGSDEKEVADSEDAKWASEAAAEDTKPKEEPVKKGDRKTFLASRRRGNSTEVLQTLLDKFRKLFPNISIVVDENEFNQKAYELGRNPQSAAILTDGIVYINPLVANNNTAFEEFSHIYLNTLEQSNKPLHDKLIEETKANGKEYMDEVLNDPAYADIHDDADAVAFEAASKMIADRAEKIFDDSRKRPIIEAIKKLWENIANWFGAKTKLDLNRDSLDDIVKKVARELNGKMDISSISSEDLEKIQNEKINREVQVNAKSIMAESSARAEWFRMTFLPDKGLREDLARAKDEGRRNIQLFQQRSKNVVDDFNKGIDKYNKDNNIKTKKDKVEILQKVNQALQDPVFRANWFAIDASAEKLIKPHVDRMRGMIDDLQEKLVDSGLLTDDLEVSITGNNDMYVNTAYYAFSGLNKGKWLDLFTPQERKQILDWISQGKYSYASKLKYRIDNNGKVNAAFVNSYGVKTEFKVDNIDALKSLLGSTKTVNAKTNLNVKNLSFSNTQNKDHEIEFKFNGLDLSGLGNTFRFSPNSNKLQGIVNEIGKANQDLNKIIDLISGRKRTTSQQAKGATKKKKELDPIKKLLLKEIKDPATNFIRTVAKQSNLLFNGQVEQAIIDSKYMANYGASSGQLTAKINNPASRLNGYYVTPEMYEFLTGKVAPSMYEIAKSGIKALAGQKTQRGIPQSRTDLWAVGSALSKMNATVLSISSNTGNYVAGYNQLLKTGNLPIGMISAMRAIEKSFNKIGSSNMTKEDIASMLTNQVPTIIRGMTKLVGEQGFLKQGISPLTEDQKKFYGVSDYSQLNSDQKARVLLEELISEGVINSSVEASVIQEMTAASFEGVVPKEMLKRNIDKILNATKKGFGDAINAASNSYGFSDSMFKAIYYMNEKKKNWATYGSVMLKKGASMEEVEKAMRDKTAMDLRKQMPTYDRSPDILKAWSKFPLIAPFIQFDYQSKVNDKNILVDIYNMIQESAKMKREGFDAESSKLGARAVWKLSAFAAANSLSYAIVKLVGSALSNYGDDDDDAVSSLLPEYRKNNQILHLDSNKKGVHEYVDFSRLDPQSMYMKYLNAFERGGFDEGVDEIIKPYVTADIFAGSIAETYAGLDKYGNFSKEIMDMNLAEKLNYIATERILPSGTAGQVENIIKGFKGREVNDVEMSGWNELQNVFIGFKRRSINIDKEIGNKLNYDYVNEISDKIRRPLKTAVEDYNAKLDQFRRGKGGITQSELNDAKEEVNLQKAEVTEKANERLGEARVMVDKYKKLGYKEDEIRKSLKESNTPIFLINLLLSERDIEFDDEGNIIKGGTFKRFKRRKSEYDIKLPSLEIKF